MARYIFKTQAEPVARNAALSHTAGNRIIALSRNWSMGLKRYLDIRDFPPSELKVSGRV